MLAPAAPDDLVELAERAQRSIDDAVPPNTRRAYEADLRHFAGWCTARGLIAMPAAPETVVLYLRFLADRGHGKRAQGFRVSSIERALAAICTSHVRSGYLSLWGHPHVKAMRIALRNEKGVRPEKKKAADDEILKRLLAVLPSSRLGIRDRALLTMGWAGAFRRSELVAIQVEHITRAPKGLVVLLPKSKTDQQGVGREVPIFFSNDVSCCPVRSLDAWQEAAGTTSGPVFRPLGRCDAVADRALDAGTVADRVKHYAKLAGLDSRIFAGHSLRRGFITTAVRRGRDADSIMLTTGHRSYSTLREYIERETIFERAAGEGLL